MALTTAQLQTLNAAILADPTLAIVPNNSDGAVYIASAFNVPAVPDFTVWKTNVPSEAVGQTIKATAFAAITAGNNDKLSCFRAWNSFVNPSKQDHRDFFNDIFSVAAGQSTRDALLVLWKRLATRGERLYTTGTGTDAVPGLLTFEGAITPQDVTSARNL